MNDRPSLTLTAEQISTLNNIRTILKRQLLPFSLVDERLVADLLLKQADLMRDAGLAAELMGYLEIGVARADENAPYSRRLRLQLAITMQHLGDYEDTIREIYGELLDFYTTQPAAERTDDYAYAMLAFGQYFASNSQHQEALPYYQSAFEQFQREGLNEGMAKAWHLAGVSYQALGQLEQAQNAYTTALSAMDTKHNAIQRATIMADYAAVLLQSGKIGPVEELLDETYAFCEQHGLWTLRAKVMRQQAYVDQLRAREATDPSIKQQWLQQATMRLHHAIANLLTIHNTQELAITYHDLGRLEAQMNNLVAAESHVRKSSELFTRIGNRRNFAVSQITLGQILLIKNHAPDEALQHIREALYIANTVKDAHTREQAARALLKIHQMQVQRAKGKSANLQASVLEDIRYTQERLSRLGMSEFADSAAQLTTQLA